MADQATTDDRSPTLTTEEIQRMFDEMGLGTEELRAAYRFDQKRDTIAVTVPQDRRAVFIRTDCVTGAASLFEGAASYADLARSSR